MEVGDMSDGSYQELPSSSLEQTDDKPCLAKPEGPKKRRSRFLMIKDLRPKKHN